MRILITIFTVLTLTFLFIRTSPAQSETTMQDIIETVSNKITELEDEKDQEIVNTTIDLLGGDNQKTLTRYLDPSFDYTILAFGDRRISKLRIIVKKMNGEDWDYVSEAASSMPDIKITPTGYDLYSVTINVQEFKPGNSTGHYAILIYHKDPLKK
jgi:hypothetical protein